ncbi:phage tail tape measure protein [uncultured Clostridium sp.]|uniref:phage tail tape measure protein n=1 Tax=uncultured Clostridium sp. TaxID=59620 RepID=UPI0025DFBCA4|nr:phage tail tape measure protein [uncultured Clostridium sp.]
MAFEVFKLMGSVFVDTTAAEDSLQRTDNKSVGLGNTLIKGVETVKKWGIAIGAAAGSAALAMGTFAVKASNDYEKACNQFQVATGATKSDMEEFGKTIKDVYGNNFGENFDDVANSMSQVRTNLWLTGDELKKTTEYALGFRDTFEVDVNESTRAAKALMDNFGVSAKEAFTMLAQGQQDGLNYSGELIDSVNEYSVQFSKLGMDVEDMFSVFDSGTQAGAFNLDKIGDAVKELSIRVIDGSDTTKEGFETLGLNADEMANKFSKGGESAKGAFNQVIESLAKCDDPIKQNLAGTDLLGTMWEDLGPQVVTSLSTANDYFDKTADTIEEINNIKYDDFGSAIEGIKRTLETNVLLPLGESILPTLNRFANWFQEKGIPRIQEFANKIQEHMPQIEEVIGILAEKFVNTIELIIDNLDTIIPLLTELGVAFGVFKIVTTISDLIGKFKALKTSIEAGKTVMEALNLSFSLSPIGIAVIAITGAIAVLTILYTKCDWFREKVNSLGEYIVSFFTETIPNAWNSLVSFFTETIPSFFEALGQWFMELPGNVLGWLGGIITSIGEWFSNLWTSLGEWLSSTWTSIVNWFTQIPYNIGYLLGSILVTISTWFQNLITFLTVTIPQIIVSIGEWLSQLPGVMWQWLSNAVSSVINWGSSLFNAGVNAASNLVNAIVSTISSIPGRMLSIGQNIVQGIWNGISGAAGWLWDKVTGFASSIVDGFKDALGIHSPSHVMRDEVGKYMAQGISVGFEEENENTNKNIERAINKTIDISSSVLGNYSFENEKQNNIADISIEKDNANLEVLSNSLDKMYSLLSEILPSLLNRKVMLDTGAIAGALINPINNGLGNNMMYQERGNS